MGRTKVNMKDTRNPDVVALSSDLGAVGDVFESGINRNQKEPETRRNRMTGGMFTSKFHAM
jgi:hypothetical protein